MIDKMTDKRRFEYDEPGSTLKMNPGTWTNAVREGKPIIKIACPDCGQSGLLDGTHTVNSAGDVSPSVVCDCGYHETIHLVGDEFEPPLP